MISLAKKLRHFRENADLSQRDMAKELGIGETSYQYYESGYKKDYMPQKFHAKIIQLAEESYIDARDVADIIGQQVQFVGDKTSEVKVPVYDFHAGMGGGGVVDSEEPIYYMTLSTEYVQRIGLARADLMALEVVGDSNVPTLQSGDQVVVDRNDKQIGQEGLFCLFDSDGVVVKRVEKIRPISDPIMLRLISDNKHHSTYDVPADDLRIIGRVVYFGRRI